MTLEGDKLKDLLLLYRAIEMQYKLSLYSDQVLEQILKSLNVARKKLYTDIGFLDVVVMGTREQDILRELNKLTLGIQYQLTKDIQEAAMVAGEYSCREYNNIMSFDGKLSNTVGFNFVSLSSEQLSAMANAPVGGSVLSDWVAKTANLIFSDEMKTELLAGAFLGEGNKKLVKRLEKSYEVFSSNAITLARTYIADANNRAAKAVYDANSDIIDEEQWCATLEVSLSGHSTCLRCAGMDGRIFSLNSTHIRPPLHPRCRCFMLPKTKSYKELGLNISELKSSLRPYTEREEGTSINTGLSRAIYSAGQYDGDFEKFLLSRDKKYQIDLLGPNRYKLLKAGEIKFADLVDKNGNVRLLKKNKEGKSIGLLM